MYGIVNIGDANRTIDEAANLLTITFNELDKDAWPDFDSAKKEVLECIKTPNICIGLSDSGELLGWVGLRPMYEKTWELHPLVVDKKHQSKGIGRTLLREIEEKARESGVIGIALGTDDETGRTSISNVDINENNIFSEIKNIRNIKRHPYEFYKKCGYMIVGIIPNANGKRKPDIWMWKSLI